MTNKTVTLTNICSCCGLTDIEYNKVCHNSGCSTYAEDESVYQGWKADPVPPADGEPVEVVAVISTNPKERGHYFTPDQLRRHNQIYKTTPANGYTVELVDRAHVTRLQAEVAHQEAQHEAVTRYAQTCLTAEANALAEVQRLESELTKARELLEEVRKDYKIDISRLLWNSIDDFLSIQSAPAAKDSE